MSSAYAKELLSLIEPSEVEVLPPIAARALDTVSTNLAKIDESTTETTQLLQKAAEETRRKQQGDFLMWCERWLKPPNVRQIQQDQVQRSVMGTCDWIWSNTTFISWYEAPVSSTKDGMICIYGPPGCGKSILASSLADHMWNNKLLALFFAFSGMNASHQKSTALIRSLLWQLVELAPQEHIVSLLHNLMLRGQPTVSELWKAFGMIATHIRRPVYCIIDGIDESKDATELHQWVTQLLETCSNLRFILLGRQHVFQGINFTYHEIEIRPTFTAADVQRVIETGINQSDILHLPELREKVSESLQQKSDGNFLWVKLMLEYLSKSLTVAEALKRLHNLPRDLETTYEDLLLGLATKLEPDELELAQKVLAFIITAQRPLSASEFQHLLSADSMSTCTCDRHSVGDHLILQFHSRILDLCGGLVNFIDDQLQLVHFSVEEFLLRPDGQWSRRRRSRKVLSFRVSLEDTHRRFGAACIQYLENCDYGFPLQEREELSRLGRYHFLHYSSKYIMTHIYQSGSSSSSILEEIERFVTLDRWIAWLELIVMNTVDYGIMVSLFEEFEKFSSWLGERSEKILQTATANLNTALDRTAKRYGYDNPRTEYLGLFLSLFKEFSLPEITEAVDSCTVQSISPLTNLEPILKIVQQDAPLSPHSQADLILRMTIHLQEARRLTDPLKIIFRLILQKSCDMPFSLLLLIGLFYEDADEYEQALETYFAAMKTVKETDATAKIRVLHTIGSAYYDLSQYSQALEYFQHVREEENKLGHENDETLRTGYWIGITCFNLTQYNEALEYLQYTLERQKSVLGDENENTLCTAYWIGLTYHNLTQYNEALEYLQYTLERQKSILGHEHEDTLSTAYWISRTYHSIGRYWDALSCLTKTLAGQERTLGTEHDETLDTLYCISLTYSMLGRNDDAFYYLAEALAGQEKALGTEHKATLLTLHWTGWIYYKFEHYEDALDCLTKARAGREKVLGPDHEDTLDTLSLIGHIYYKLNRYNDALESLETYLTGVEKVLQPTNETISKSLDAQTLKSNLEAKLRKTYF